MQVGTHSGQAISTERRSSFSPIDKTYLGILLPHQPMGSNYVYTTIPPMEDPCPPPGGRLRVQISLSASIQTFLHFVDQTRSSSGYIEWNGLRISVVKRRVEITIACTTSHIPPSRMDMATYIIHTETVNYKYLTRVYLQAIDIICLLTLASSANRPIGNCAECLVLVE